MCLALWALRTMAPLRCAAKCDPFLSLDCAGVEGVGAQSPIKFCHLATLPDEIDGDLAPLLRLEVHDYALLAGVALGLQ